MNRLSLRATAGLVGFAVSTDALLAQDSPGLSPPSADAAGAFPAQKHFSPYAGRNSPTRVYWGDTHLNIGISMDAGALGAHEAKRFDLDLPDEIPMVTQERTSKSPI